MKKAVLLIVLLLSFLGSFSAPIQGSEINNEFAGMNQCNFSLENAAIYDFHFSMISGTPGDTNSYLYLDPTSNTIYLSILLNDPSKISIVVLDILGSVVWTLPETTYDSGRQLLSGSMNLVYGQYIVKVLKNGYVYKTQKILVIK